MLRGVAIGDLSTDEGAAAVHAEARAALGGNIEILVNNAGGSSTGNTAQGAPIDISMGGFISNYHSNALSSVRLCRLAVPDMVAANLGGSSMFPAPSRCSRTIWVRTIPVRRPH
jgi:3-oxoacyl-[acyl-carrier protein] reductase